jgi:hypothetical protein
MYAVVCIRTPTDFERTMGTQDYVLHKWLPDDLEIERETRRLTDRIFADLQYVGGEAELVRGYLEGVDEPLQDLHERSFQLVGVVTSGQLTLPTLGDLKPIADKVPWKRAHYFVAADPAYYRIAEARPVRVHKLGVDCDGMRELTRRDDAEVSVYPSRSAVAEDLEDEPWCPVCFLEVAAGS